ncbi:MAG: radical SAM protein, partial [Smithellaceae bacterium]
MKTISNLLDSGWHDRYRRIASLNIRSSIYDLTNRCNLRCKGCFFFSSGEHRVAEERDIGKWEQFIDREKERGVNLAILIGGEPTLCMDRLAAFYKRLPTYCATNGLIKVPRDQFPDMMVGISLWGGGEDEKVLRGKDTFAVSSKNYEGDPYTYYLYTITPKQVGKIEPVIKRIVDVGLKVHLQLLSNDEGVDGFSWRPEELRDLRFEMDEMLDSYPQTIISSKYYHEVITTGVMQGRRFGWNECPSVTE